MEYAKLPTPLHNFWIKMEIAIDVDTMIKEERNNNYERRNVSLLIIYLSIKSINNLNNDLKDLHYFQKDVINQEIINNCLPRIEN